MASITIRTLGGVTVVDVSGPLVLSEGAGGLRDTVRGLIVQGGRQLLLNLAAVTFLDSAGVGELIAARTAALNRGAELKLLRPSRKVFEVLHGTRVARVFEILQDEAEAVGSFAESAEAAEER